MSSSQFGFCDLNGELKSVDPDQLALLVRLEQANRLLETDMKSLHNVSPHIHRKERLSRTSSMNSVMSSASVNSNVSGLEDSEDSWNVWNKIIGDWESYAKKKSSLIKDMTRKGIPARVRGVVWRLLCSDATSLMHGKYADYLKQPSPHEKVIRCDVSRTYPDHDLFREKDGIGQEALFNVVKAYSVCDREVGYCQGSCFIAGLLLMEMTEEEAFIALVHIMQELKLRELFKPNMAELGFCMFQLEFLLQENLPDLAAHFRAHNFFVSMVASQWFLTVFAATLSLPIVCRIFDMFLVEGIDVIFKVAMAILQLSLDSLLGLDMEGMVVYLQKDLCRVIESNPEQLFSAAARQKYNGKKMKKLEKEYTQMKTKEQEELVEIRRLRTENRLLQQRIDNVEKEMAGLLNRVVQDKMAFAQQQEEIHVLRRDLSVCREREADVAKQLVRANKELNQQRQNGRVSGGAECCMDKVEAVARLTGEVEEARKMEREAAVTVSDLHARMRQLEAANRELQRDPNAVVERLQEELIACKMREAESSLSLKALTHTVHDLHKHYQKHVEQTSGSSSKSKQEVRAMQEELMTLRIREALATSELTDLKQKVMELETKGHIGERQLKRMADEEARSREMVEEAEKREAQLRATIQALERQVADLDNKRKEEAMVYKIREAEHGQAEADMRRRIAELEIANQELLTAEQLHGDNGGCMMSSSLMTDSLMLDSMHMSMARPLSNSAAKKLCASTDSSDDSGADDLQLALSQSIIGELPGASSYASHGGKPVNTSLDSGVVESATDVAAAATTDDETGARSKQDWPAKGRRSRGVALEDRTPTQDSFDATVFK